MNRIYTRTGDAGTTGIFGKERVSKTDIRIEANGTIDELNTTIGIVRSFLPDGHKSQPLLKEIQVTLMAVMSNVATRSERRTENPNIPPDTLVSDIESAIDAILAESTVSDYFILPGGTPAAAFMHQARVTARKAERMLWRLNEKDPVPECILQYINRLSDLFFVMARHELESAGLSEERWQAFSYKSKKK